MAEGESYVWNSGMDRIKIIQEGIPYASVQKISQKLGATIKEILNILVYYHRYSSIIWQNISRRLRGSPQIKFSENLRHLREALFWFWPAFAIAQRQAGLSRSGIPQTTYNKKRRDKSLFNERDSELILHLIELMDFGENTFNQEKNKFHRWLKKPNPSLGGHIPMSLLGSNTGILEVKNCLNRIQYGNLA